ncbi:hypothetical protein DICPUDRAFT_58510 [Dictyostelium purpureum]|uniref:Fatty acid 2-hydroxylase n=1 Tax=Dictyostelium purpureum TaxID=5786 RepID=F1A1B9_DICPU|nr:uncharacterized protein DICPUDRAFT_58510 [Dictyostelium purpureum]EGC30012.1 hypothetical protein DICPUDRAFT_58510 [Dictyostelium purpureum]|eukprot:XP_003293458.1 hypothetical protein DICPUDRAFT_58510 [Dictyostelium purpureum]
MIESKEILVSEVKKHNDKSDAWVSLDGQVYDITSFMFEHPGGSDILIEHLGEDISEVFIDGAIHEHSEVAFNMLKSYHIGRLAGYRKPEGKQTVSEYIKQQKLKKQQSNTSNKISYTSDNTIDENILKLVDPTKPMVPQLKYLVGPNYMKWIHSQTGLKKIIIFDNSILELFTRWPWWYIFVLWIPIITTALIYSTLQEKSSVLSSITTFFIGLFSWGLIEYILHRWVFHIETTSYWGNFFHFFIHGIHHLTPHDHSRLTFPPMFSVLIGYGAFKGFLKFPDHWHLTGLPWAFYAGVACGYMLYDTVHYYFHHADIEWLPQIFKDIKTNHLNHHYKDDAKNYGVTSPIFDYVFGTFDK